MRTLGCLAVLLAGACAWCQGLPAASLAPVTRALDDFGRKFEPALTDAREGDLAGLRVSLPRANQAWRAIYHAFRDTPTTDAQWQTDFDAILAAFEAATNAVSPEADAEKAKAQLEAAAQTLEGLRTRNDLPDVQAAVQEVRDSVGDMQDVATKMQQKNLTADELASLSTQLEATTTVWRDCCQVLLEVNPLALNDKQLARAKQLAKLQNRVFNGLSGALATQNRRKVVAELNKSEVPLSALMLLVGSASSGWQRLLELPGLLQQR